MTPMRIQTQAVAGFSCLGADCPDTCCQGWGMQVTRETVEKYAREAPELGAAVTKGESEFIMRRDPSTDRCVKFADGLCSIHRDYGEAFLGDACHFYPRITRALGDTLHTTAALSCPEAARRLIESDRALLHTAREEMRTPYSLKNYLPEGVAADEALAMHEVLLTCALDDSRTAAWNLLRVSAVARALQLQPVAMWKDALPLYLSMADSRIPAAEPMPADLFNLLHTLHGLARAAGKVPMRLQGILDAMADSLGVTFTDAGGIVLAADAAQRAVQQLAHMRAQAEHLQPVLRRYLAAQLSQALFPFGGFGATLTDRITIIGLRLAMVRLALSTLDVVPSNDEIVRVIYSVSRFQDHLADPALTIQICAETGWMREPRLRALLGE